jgi:hypothetical protein
MGQVTYYLTYSNAAKAPYAVGAPPVTWYTGANCTANAYLENTQLVQPSGPNFSNLTFNGWRGTLLQYNGGQQLKVAGISYYDQQGMYRNVAATINIAYPLKSTIVPNVKRPGGHDADGAACAATAAAHAASAAASVARDLARCRRPARRSSPALPPPP